MRLRYMRAASVASKREIARLKVYITLMVTDEKSILV